MTTGNFLLDWLLAIPIGTLVLAISLIVTLLSVLYVIYIYKFGGIKTAILYWQKGGTIKFLKAKETEKTVSTHRLTFSKIRQIDKLDEKGKVVKGKDGKSEKEYVAAAEPSIMIKGIVPYRVFYCQEGHPMILPFDHFVTIAPISADELHILSEGGLAKGLIMALLKKMAKDWFTIISMFMLGFFFHSFVTVILP